jgi:PAS domain S-box-containing protein
MAMSAQHPRLAPTAEFATALGRQTGVFQSVLDSMSAGVVVADEAGRFLFFNPAAERILGIGLTDAAPNQWTARYGCFLPDRVTPYPTDQLPLVRAIRGETVDEAEVFIRNAAVPDGVWLSVNARPLRDDDGIGRGGVAVFRDVTARRHADQRVAAEHAVTRILAEAVTLTEATPKVLQAICELLDWLVGVIWEVDHAADRLRCVEVWHQPAVDVAAFEEVTRQSRFPRGIGLPGRVWASGQLAWIPDVTADDNFPRRPFAVQCGLRAAFGFPLRLRGRVLGILEFFSREIRQPDDELIWMLGSVSSQLGQFIERKLAEEALRNSEALYHSLVEGLPLNVFRKDCEGRFTFGNQRFYATLGKPANEVLGKTDLDFFPSELAGKYRRDDCRVMETGAVFEDVEELLSATGERTWVQVLKTPVHDANGKVVGIQGIFWDVTDKRRSEEQLRRTAAELERSNRDLEQFAYVASHDLQEPLRMVASYCQLLQRRYKGRLDADGGDFLGFAVDGATRMQGLISDLLTYARVDSRGRPLRPTACGDAVDRAVANLKLAIEESGAAITRDELPTVRADETQLAQLFQNLIGNALKFRGAEPPRIHVSAGRDGSEWVLGVRDNGIGIEPQFFERIFVIFQRLHGRGEYPGTGIGLALCKKIVERHGGRIWVESQPGQGSAFFFTLPAREEDRP